MDSIGVNSQISHQAAHIGVLTAPDSVGKVTLYSAKEAEAQLKEMENDIYQKSQSINPASKTGSTPAAVKYTGVAALAVFLWTVCKKLIKK